MALGVIDYDRSMARWEPDAASRLMTAALGLYDERGYDATTVTDIAVAAGLTKRTYFRHFPDKREVLFSGSADSERAWVEAVHGAPPEAGPVAAVAAGFGPLAAFFDTLHAAARTRARVVAGHPDLLEREAAKLEGLAVALAGALRERGVGDIRADLAARVGTTVYRTAFARWVRQDDARPGVLGRLLDAELGELRAVLADGD